MEYYPADLLLDLARASGSLRLYLLVASFYTDGYQAYITPRTVARCISVAPPFSNGEAAAFHLIMSGWVRHLHPEAQLLALLEKIFSFTTIYVVPPAYSMYSGNRPSPLQALLGPPPLAIEVWEILKIYLEILLGRGSHPSWMISIRSCKNRIQAKIREFQPQTSARNTNGPVDS